MMWQCVQNLQHDSQRRFLPTVDRTQLYKSFPSFHFERISVSKDNKQVERETNVIITIIDLAIFPFLCSKQKVCQAPASLFGRLCCNSAQTD
jgi:hypothetical protein